MINLIVWIYSTVSTILIMWTIYLFTIREWLDRFSVHKMNKPYDMNGITRWKKLIDIQLKKKIFL